jgi:CRP/FNR family transcriptional regulator, cyclic AMP receptor protein
MCGVASAGAGHAAVKVASLLDLDPDLGVLLDDDRRRMAQRDLRVRLTVAPVGEWDATRLQGADPAHFGLLVVEGVLAREIVLSGLVSTELLGEGDIIRPWRLDDAPLLVPIEERWNALSLVRLALLDRRVGGQLAGYPEIGAAIVDRATGRARRLAVLRAIGNLTRVEDRLTMLFWHLAERWGHVTAGGITVPLALPHRVIGELIGARRPTVSTALAELAAQNRIIRRDDNTWLLVGPAPAHSDAAELVRQRRRLIPDPRPELEAPPRPDLTVVPEASEHGRIELERLRSELAGLTMRARELRAARHQARRHAADRARPA